MKKHKKETKVFFYEAIYQGIRFTIQPIEDEGFLRFECLLFEGEVGFDPHLLMGAHNLEEIIEHCKKNH